VGFVPGVTLSKWRRIWAERHPSIPLAVVPVTQADQRGALDRSEVDLCFVRLPLETDGLHLIPLYEEVAVVVVPRDHPVSVFESVTRAELAEEDLVETDDPEAGIAAVAAGGGIYLTAQSLAHTHARRDVVARPVSDLPPTRVGMAWRRDDPHALTEEWVGIVRGRSATSTRGQPQPAKRRRKR